jgi:hypothetical protein
MKKVNTTLLAFEGTEAELTRMYDALVPGPVRGNPVPMVLIEPGEAGERMLVICYQDQVYEIERLAEEIG